MAWILDVVFIILLFVGCLIGAKVGLVKGVCKLAGWVLSIVIPIVCCVPFKDSLEKSFGMVTAISNGVKSATLGGWISVGIAFFLLILIVRLGTFLLSRVGTLLVNGLKPAAVINSLLGAALGLVEAFLAAYFLILIFGWLPFGNIHLFIEKSTIVGAIYRSDLMGRLPF